MRLLILTLLLFFSTALYAQTTFTVQYDTVHAAPALGSAATVEDGVSAVTGTVVIVWKVVASNFPANWLTANAMCDNSSCYILSNLWSPAAGTLSVKTSNSYGVAHLDTPGGDFHMLIGFADTNTLGCYYLTVRMNNQALPSDTATETYIVCNNPTLGVTTTTLLADNIIVYPNPAHDELRLFYNTASDINKIVLYNGVGKIAAAGNVTGSNTSLSLTGLPAGLYFIRLIDSKGAVFATKKLTKQ